MIDNQAAPELRNVVMRFDLPYVLRVVDSIRQETIPEGYEHYIIAIDGIPMMLRFEKELRDIGGVQIAVEDRRGLLNYSAVQVWFDSTFFQRFPFHSYRERAYEFGDVALTAVNYFLETYADVTGSFWISPIKFGDLADVRFVGVYTDGRQEPFILGAAGPTGVALGSLISIEQDNSMRERMASGYRTDELQKLAYAITHLFDKEDYWSAGLAIEVLFEAKVARILRLAFDKQGLPESEIDEKFELRDGIPRSITNLVKTYLPELTGIAVDDTAHPLAQAYAQWFTKARVLRNDIAHGKSFHVTRTEAVEAIDAVRNFLEQIEAFMPDRHRTKIEI